MEGGAVASIHSKEFIMPLVEKYQEYLELVPKGGSNGDDRRKSCALVLESTRKGLATAIKKANMFESVNTTTAQIDSYAQTIFPVLMNVFPNLIAHELVSVQPMAGPIGAVFYYDYKYASNKGRVKSGDNMIETFDPYYTSEEVEGEFLVTADGTNFGGAGVALSATTRYSPLRPLNSSNNSNHKVMILEVDADDEIVQMATDDGAGGFTFVPAGAPAAGAVDYQSGTITGFKFRNIPANGNRIVAHYWYNMEGNTDVPRGAMDIRLQTIEASTRKLNATWSVEAADNLRALHGIEGEAMFLVGFSNEIGLEIDREILNDLINGAETSATWNRGGTPSGISELDYLRTLFTVLSEQANQVHRKTKRAPANWIVTSPEVSALFAQFQTHGDYLPSAPVSERDPSYGNITSDFGAYRTGALMNRFNVYQDPYMRRNQILMGLKGRTYLDAGYVYAPYIPLEMTHTFQDPDDQQFKKGLRTRYAKKLLRGSFYATVQVQGI